MRGGTAHVPGSRYQQGDQVEVERFGQWYPAQITSIDQYRGIGVRIDDGGSKPWNEWVQESKIRASGGKAPPPTRDTRGTTPPGPTPPRNAPPGGPDIGSINGVTARLDRIEPRINQLADQLEDSQAMAKPLKAVRAQVEAQLTEVTELSEEVHQSLRGLREIGDYAGTVRGLEGEVSDTRDAVELMMAMLEKTLTIKDGNALLDDQEARMDDKISHHEAGLQDMQGDITGLHKKVETAAADLMKVAHEVGRHGEADALRLTEKIAEVEEVVTESTSGLGNQMSALERVHADQVKIWNDALVQAENAIDKRLAHQAEEHKTKLEKLTASYENRFEQLSATNARAVADLSAKIQNTGSISDAAVRKVENALDLISTRVQADVNALGTSIRESETALDERFQRLAQRVEAEENEMADLKRRRQIETPTDTQRQLDELSSRLGAELEVLKESVTAVQQKETAKPEDLLTLAERFSRHENSMGESINQLKITTEGLSGRVEEQIVLTLREMESTSDNLQQSIRSAQQQSDQNAASIQLVVKDTDARFTHTTANIDAQLTKTAQAMRDSCNSIELSIRGKIETQDTTIQQQAARVAEQVTALGRTVNAQHVDVSSALISVQNTLKTRTTELDKKLEDYKKAGDRDVKVLSNNATKIDADFNKQLTSQASKQADVVSKLEKSIEPKFRELTSKIQDTRQFSSDLNKTCEQHISDKCSAVEGMLTQRMSEQDRVTDQQGKALQDTNQVAQATQQALNAFRAEAVEQHGVAISVSEQNSIAIEVTRKEADASDKEIKSMISEVHRQIEREKDTTDTKLADQSRAFGTTVEQLSQRINQNQQDTAGIGTELQGKINEQRLQLLEYCSTVEKKLRGENDVQDANAAEQKQYLIGLCEHLEVRFTGFHADTEANIVAVAKEIEVAHRASVEQLKASLVDADQSIRDLTTQSQQQDSELLDRCSKLEASLERTHREWKSRSEDTSNRVDANQKQVTDWCATLEKTQTSDSVAMKAIIERNDIESTNRYTKLEQNTVTQFEEQGLRLGEHAAKFPRILQDSAEKYGNITRTQAEHAVKNEKHFTSLTQNIKQVQDLVYQDVAALDKKFASHLDKRDVQLREVANSVQRNQLEQQNSSKQLESSITANHQKLNISIQQQRDYFVDFVGKLEQKVNSQMELHSKRTDAEHDHFEELNETLRAKVDERMKASEIQVEALRKTLKENADMFVVAVDQLDKRCTDMNTAQTTRVDKMQTSCEEMITQQERVLRDDAASIRQDSLHRFEMLEQKLDDQFTSLDKTFREKEAKHDALFDETRSLIQHSFERCEASCDTIDKKFSASVLTLDNRVAQHFTHFTEELERVYSGSAAKDIEHDVKVAALSQSLTDMDFQFTELNGSTDRKLTAQITAIHERVERQQQTFSDLLLELDTRNNDKNKAQDTELEHIHAAISKNHLELVQTCETMEKKIVETANQSQQDFNHCNTLCTSWEKKMGMEQAANATRLQECRDTIARQHLELTDMCGALARSVTAQYEGLDARFVEEFQKIKDYCNAIEHTHTQVINEEHEKFNSRCHLLEKECNDINVNLTRKSDHLQQLIEAFKVHMAESIEEITYTVQTHYKHLTDTDQSLDTKINEKHQALSERYEGVQKHFEDVCLNLEFKLTEKNLEQDERMNGLCDSQQEHLTHLSTICSEMDKKLSADIDAQAEKIADNYSDLQNRYSDIESKLTQQIEHQHEHLTDVCRGLANTITSKFTSLDDKFVAQFAAQDELVRTQFQHVLTVTDQMDSKFDQKTDEMRTTLVSSLEHLTVVSDGLEKKVTDGLLTLEADMNAKYDVHESKVEEIGGSILAAHSELGLMNEFMSKLDNRVNLNYGHFTNVLETIDEKLRPRLSKIEEDLHTTDLKVDAHHEHFSEICNELNVKFSNSVEALQVQAVTTREQIDENHQTIASFAANLDGTVREHHKHFEELHAEVATKVKDATQSVNTRIDEEREHFTAICASLDQKSTEACLELGHGLSSVSTDVIKHHREFTNICDGIDRKFSEKAQIDDQRAAGLKDAMNETQASMKTLGAELEHEIRAEATTRGEKMSEQFQELTQLATKIDKRYMEKTRAQDDRMSEINSVVTQNNQRLTQANSSLDTKLTSHVQRLGGIVKDLSIQMEKNYKQITAYCERLDASITTVTETITAQVEHNRQHFTERCDDLDKSLLERVMELRSQQETAHQHFTSITQETARVCDANHRQNEVRLDNLDLGLSSAIQQFVENSAVLQAKFTKEINDQTERISNHTKHFATTVANVEQTFNEKYNMTTDTITSLAGTVEENQRQASAKCDKLQDTIESERAASIEREQTNSEHASAQNQETEKKLMDRIIGHEPRLADMAQAIQAQRAQFVELDNRIGKALAEQQSLLSGRIESSHAELERACTALRQSLDEGNQARDARLGKLNDHVDSNIQRLVTEFSNLESQFAEEQAAQADRIENNIQYFNAVSSNIEIKFDERNAAQDARVNELNEGVHQFFNDRLVELDRKNSNENAAQNFRLDELNSSHGMLQQNLTEAIEQLDQKYSNITLAQDGRIEEYYREFTVLNAGLDEKMHTKNTSQDEAIADILSTIQQNQDVLKDVARDLDKTKEKNVSQDERMDDLSGVIDDHHHYFTDATAMLDTKMRDAQQSQAAALDSLQQDFAATCANLEAKTSAANDSQVERIENHHKYFTEVCNQLDKTIDTKMKGVDKKFGDVLTQMDTNNKHLSDAVDAADHNIRSAIDQKVQRLREQNQQLAESCTILDTKLDDAIKLQQAHFDETVSSMDQKLIEWTKDIDTRAAEMGSTINENHRYFSDLIKKLDDQLNSETSALKLETASNKADARNAIDDLRRQNKDTAAEHENLLETLATGLSAQEKQLITSCADLEGVVAVSVAQLEEKNSQQDRHFTELSIAVDRKATDQHDAASGRFDEQSATIHDHHSYFTSIITQLDAKTTNTAVAHATRFEEESEQREALLKNLSTSLQQEFSAGIQNCEQRSDELQKHFTQIFSGQDKKFTEACLSLDKKFTEEMGDRDRRAEDDKTLANDGYVQLSRQVVDQLQATNTKFTDVCIGLDEKLSTQNADLQKSLTSDVGKLDERLTSAASKLDQKVSKQLSTVDEKFTDTSIGLDQKMMTLLQEKDQTLQKHQQHFTDEITKLNKQNIKQTSDLEAKFTDTAIGLDRKLMTLLEESEHASRKANAAVTAGLKDMEKKVSDDGRKLDTRVTTEIEKLAAALAKETGKVSERVSQRCEAIEKSLANVGDATRKKIDDMNKLQVDHYREQRSAAQKADGAIRSVAGDVDRNQKTAAKAAETLQTAISMKHAAQDTLVTNTRTDFTGKVRRVSHRLVQLLVLYHTYSLKCGAVVVSDLKDANRARRGYHRSDKNPNRSNVRKY
jgi:chromosome segregation ATPase